MKLPEGWVARPEISLYYKINIPTYGVQRRIQNEKEEWVLRGEADGSNKVFSTAQEAITFVEMMFP